MAYVYTFLSAAAAWGLVALLTHMEARQAAINGAIAGAICALLAVLLHKVDGLLQGLLRFDCEILEVHSGSPFFLVFLN